MVMTIQTEGIVFCLKSNKKCIDKFWRFKILSSAKIGMRWSQRLMFVIGEDKKSAQKV